MPVFFSSQHLLNSRCGLLRLGLCAVNGVRMTAPSCGEIIGTQLSKRKYHMQLTATYKTANIYSHFIKHIAKYYGLYL